MITLTGLKTNNPLLVNPDHVMFITYADTGAIPIIGQAPPPKITRIAFRTGGTLDVRESIEEIESKTTNQ